MATKFAVHVDLSYRLHRVMHRRRMIVLVLLLLVILLFLFVIGVIRVVVDIVIIIIIIVKMSTMTACDELASSTDTDRLNRRKGRGCGC